MKGRRCSGGIKSALNLAIRNSLVFFKKSYFFKGRKQDLFILTMPYSTWDTEFPDQGLHPCSLHWECRVLTTGPPGKSLPGAVFICCVAWNCEDFHFFLLQNKTKYLITLISYSYSLRGTKEPLDEGERREWKKLA